MEYAGELENPGPFAAAMGPMTGLGFLLLHLLFGVVVGALYEAFVSRGPRRIVTSGTRHFTRM